MHPGLKIIHFMCFYYGGVGSHHGTSQSDQIAISIACFFADSSVTQAHLPGPRAVREIFNPKEGVNH